MMPEPYVVFFFIVRAGCKYMCEVFDLVWVATLMPSLINPCKYPIAKVVLMIGPSLIETVFHIPMNSFSDFISWRSEYITLE